MSRKKFDFHTFVMRLTAVLLGLVMLTTGMVSGRYARYVTSASGSDSARVAKFHVTHTGEVLTQSIAQVPLRPGTSVTKTVTVTYDMEVAARSIITATNAYEGVPGDLPLTFRVYAGDTASGTATTGSHSFVDTHTPGSNVTKTYTVEITFPAVENSLDYNGMVDMITISVTTEQVD